MSVDGFAASAARDLGQGWKVNPFLTLEPGSTTILADIKGQGAIKHIWITDSAKPRNLILRIYFDGQSRPAVEAPLSDFFCNTDYQFRQLSSLAMCVNPGKAHNCYFGMYRWHITDPIYFKEDLKVTIQALGWRSGGRYLPLQDDISSVAYWYSDNLHDIYPELPDKNGLELV